MRTIIPTTVELGDEPHDLAASWHSTPASVYGEPRAETVTVNVLAAGIEIGHRAATAINGLNEIADHLTHVLARVHELVQNLERDAQVGYQRTAHELESDMRGHARMFTAAERNAHLQHERELDVVARSLGVGVGYGNAKPATQQDRPCRACKPGAALPTYTEIRETLTEQLKAEHMPDDLFGDLMK